MTRHISPNNQTTVPVLDQDGNPLTPTRPSRARRWLETGKAIKCWTHGRFAVKLLNIQASQCTVPETTLNINPGARNSGLTVTVQTQDGAKVVSANELHHRGHRISQAMISRRSHRTNRRGRLRRRPARFNNRTRKPGWLPPSLESIRANILTNVRHLRDLFPISSINIETCKFDPRLMQDPDISGTEYQESERDHMQTREYVLQRDERTCQYCGKTGGKIETDHIVPKSQNGPYRVSNLVTACRKCNQAKDDLPLEEFLKDDPQRLTRIRSQLKKTLSSATHMNQLMPLLLKGLEELGIPFEETDAISTAYTRKRLGVSKTHANDAACLGDPDGVINIPEEVTIIRSVGHGKRQMLTPPSQYGTPRYKEGPDGRNSPYRAYCRLPREVQGHMTMPGHKLRQGRAQGITSGDLIRYTHPKDGVVTGYAGMTNRNTRAQADGKKGVKLQAITLLERNNGYRYSRESNESPSRR